MRNGNIQDDLNVQLRDGNTPFKELVHVTSSISMLVTLEGYSFRDDCLHLQLAMCVLGRIGDDEDWRIPNDHDPSAWSVFHRLKYIVRFRDDNGGIR